MKFFTMIRSKTWYQLRVFSGMASSHASRTSWTVRPHAWSSGQTLLLLLLYKLPLFLPNLEQFFYRKNLGTTRERTQKLILRHARQATDGSSRLNHYLQQVPPRTCRIRDSVGVVGRFWVWHLLVPECQCVPSELTISRHGFLSYFLVVRSPEWAHLQCTGEEAWRASSVPDLDEVLPGCWTWSAECRT